MPAPDPHTLEPTVLRDVAIQVAEAAGALLLAALEDERATVSTKSTATDMVTEMDRASEALVVDRLLELRPHDAIVGEEGADHAGTSGVCWIVDPLDGTTNYLYRLPGWNVSIGAEIDGIPVAGAVCIPGHGDLFAGAAGAGSTVNGRPLALTDPAALPLSLIGTGFHYSQALRRQQASSLSQIIDQIRDIRRSGAAATDLCHVACGRLDAYFEHGLAPWDRVAGTVIAREAGASVELFATTPLGSPLVVAAHPERMDELLVMLDDVGLGR